MNEWKLIFSMYPSTLRSSLLRNCALRLQIIKYHYNYHCLKRSFASEVYIKISPNKPYSPQTRDPVLATESILQSKSQLRHTKYIRAFLPQLLKLGVFHYKSYLATIRNSKLLDPIFKLLEFLNKGNWRVKVKKKAFQFSIKGETFTDLYSVKAWFRSCETWRFAIMWLKRCRLFVLK